MATPPNLIKTGPASITAGEPITYTLTLSAGSAPLAAGATLTDTLPAGVTFSSVTLVGSPPPTFSVSQNGQQVIITTTSALPAGATAVFNVNGFVDPAATGTLTNTVAGTTVAGTPIAGAPQSATTVVAVSVAGLSVTKSGPSVAFAGQTITYYVTVANAGPSAASGLVLTDQVSGCGCITQVSQISGPTFSVSTPGACPTTPSACGCGCSSKFSSCDPCGLKCGRGSCSSVSAAFAGPFGPADLPAVFAVSVFVPPECAGRNIVNTATLTNTTSPTVSPTASVTTAVVKVCHKKRHGKKRDGKKEDKWVGKPAKKRGHKFVGGSSDDSGSD